VIRFPTENRFLTLIRLRTMRSSMTVRSLRRWRQAAMLRSRWSRTAMVASGSDSGLRSTARRSESSKKETAWVSESLDRLGPDGDIRSRARRERLLGSCGGGHTDDEEKLRAFAANDPVVTTGTGRMEVGNMLGGFVRQRPDSQQT